MQLCCVAQLLQCGWLAVQSSQHKSKEPVLCSALANLYIFDYKQAEGIYKKVHVSGAHPLSLYSFPPNSIRYIL